MAIIRLFHGTSGKKAEAIKAYGFGLGENGYWNKDMVWDCSDESKTYFYDYDKVWANSCGDEDPINEEKLTCALEYANGNVQITAAFEENLLPYTVVFEVVIDTEKIPNAIDYIFDDTSCDNMHEAVTIQDSILNEWIKEKLVKVIIHEFYFCTKIALLYIAPLYRSKHLQNKFDQLNPLEKDFIDSIARTSIFLEDMFCLDEINTYTWID